jgi:hypothetical protein
MALFKRQSKLDKFEKMKTESDHKIVRIKSDLKSVEKQYSDSIKVRDETRKTLSNIKSRNNKNTTAIDQNNIKRTEKILHGVLENGGRLVGKRRELQQELTANKNVNREIASVLKVERAIDKSEKQAASLKAAGSKPSKLGNFARKAGSKAHTGVSVASRQSKKAGTAVGRGAVVGGRASKSAGKKSGSVALKSGRAVRQADDATNNVVSRQAKKRASKSLDSVARFAFGADSKPKKKKKSKPKRVVTKTTTKVFGK